MDDSYARLVENLPPRFPPGRERRADARGVRAAVEALPLANPAQAAQGLERILDGMLATAWPGAERIVALGLLRTPVAGWCDGIERQIAAESHPLPPAKLQGVMAAQGLHWKLARAHALALHELCAPDGRIPRFKSRLAATATVHALVHLDHVLLWAYRQYQSPPQGAWRLVHALHAFAVNSGVADTEVDDPLPDGVPLDARAAYAHILLLALSNPYRFSMRELREARQLTRCFGTHCVLVRAGSGGIGVDTDSDGGPGSLGDDRRDPGAGVLCLDLAPLERFLDEHAAMRPPGIEHVSFRRRNAPPVESSAAFVERLRAGWKASSERGHRRLDAGHALDAAIGMHALHYVLAGNTDFAAFMSAIHGNAIMLSSREHAPSWIAGADAGQAQTFAAEVLDQSAGGYRLRLHAADGPRIRVGEVIGLAPAAEEDEDREWMVGLIRWLRRDGDHVFAGVELLSRRARAAGLRAVSGEGEPLAPQRAVELEERRDEAGDRLFSLLVPHLFDRRTAGIEVALPADPADWSSRPDVTRCNLLEAAQASASYFKVILTTGTVRDGDVVVDGAELLPDTFAGTTE